MIHMPLKWHHVDKCNKNCKKVDVLTSILARLSSFAPTHDHNKQFILLWPTLAFFLCSLCCHIVERAIIYFVKEENTSQIVMKNINK
jgi:hypothetical protein